MLKRLVMATSVIVLLGGAAGAALTDGLAAHYKMERGLGDVAFDYGPQKLNGKIVGAKWIETAHGPALEFDGTSAYVECGKGDVLGLTDEVSLSAWIHPKALPTGEPAIAGEDPRSYAMTYYTNGNLYFYPVKGGGIALKTPVAPGKLYHVAATFDGKLARLYVNGSLKKTRDLEKPSKVTSGLNVVIGGGNRPGVFFNGVIDDVRIYKRALTEKEVKALHAMRAK